MLRLFAPGIVWIIPIFVEIVIGPIGFLQGGDPDQVHIYSGGCFFDDTDIPGSWLGNAMAAGAKKGKQNNET